MAESDKIVDCIIRLRIDLIALAAILNKSVDEVELLWRENKLDLMVVDEMQSDKSLLSSLVLSNSIKLENPDYEPGEYH